jgi:inosine/xanthosine triphosphate pyrophosphatase family protein
MKKLILASGNAGKLREIQAIGASIAESVRPRRMLNCRSSSKDPI